MVNPKYLLASSADITGSNSQRPQPGPDPHQVRHGVTRVRGWARPARTGPTTTRTVDRLMIRFVAKRLALMPLLLCGIVTVAFLLSHAVSANPLASIVGERNLGNPEVVRAATERWGLDKSLPEQYVAYIANLLQGDLGTSFRTKARCGADLADRLPGHAGADRRRAGDRDRRRRRARRAGRPDAGQDRRQRGAGSSRWSGRRCRCSGSG